MKKLKGILFAMVLLAMSMGITAYASDITMKCSGDSIVFRADVANENQIMYSAVYDGERLQSVYSMDSNWVKIPINPEEGKEYSLKAFCWDKITNSCKRTVCKKAIFS